MKIYKPVDSSETILIFIHGFMGGEDTWMTKQKPNSLISYLLKDTFLGAKFHYGIFTYETSILPNKPRLIRLFLKHALRKEHKSSLPISSISKNLKTKVDNHCADYKNVILIGHSMGGLIAKYCINEILETEQESKVKLFITLATPHLGAGLGDIAHLLFRNPQALDLSLLSETINTLTSRWVKKRNLPERIYFTALNDDVVKIGASGLECYDVVIKDTDANHSTIANPRKQTDDVVIGLIKVLTDFFKNKSSLWVHNQNYPYISSGVQLITTTKKQYVKLIANELSNLKYEFYFKGFVGNNFLLDPEIDQIMNKIEPNQLSNFYLILTDPDSKAYDEIPSRRGEKERKHQNSLHKAKDLIDRFYKINSNASIRIGLYAEDYNIMNFVKIDDILFMIIKPIRNFNEELRLRIELKKCDSIVQSVIESHTHEIRVAARKIYPHD